MKKILFAVFLCLSQLGAQAQTMREAFAAMPDSLQALLSKNNRMDMMDFLDSHMEAKVTNRLDGQSSMDTLTADYLKISLASNTVLEMKLISREDEKVIAVLHTSAGPVKDSVLKFYTTDWKETEGKVTLPAFSAYEAKPRSELTEEQVQLLESLADMELTEMQLSATDNTLTCKLSLEILTKEDQEKARELVKPLKLELK